jgi:tRNA/tmRNA/rRNA uracil-C5-methylase (TrmA/RlmC/RlmD family)
MQLELNIEKVAHGGVFVARPEGKVVFVEGALPGEKVLAEIVDEKSSFQRAVVKEVLHASEHRQTHIWPESAQGAGGIDFGHVELSYQRELKTQVLQESLLRFAKLDSKVVVKEIDQTDGLHYRTRIQAHYDNRGRACVKKVRSDDLVEVQSLPLADEKLERLALKNSAGYKDQRISFAIDTFGNVSPDPETKVLSQVVGERLFELSPETFWQAHRAAPAALTADVLSKLQALDPVDVVDLYGGVGLFGAAIASAQPMIPVTSVELNKQAVKDGKKSTRDLKNLSFETSDVLMYLRRREQKLDSVVLDPPRSGANSKVLNQIARLGAKNIVYVACDPVAAARDLNELTNLGYRLVELSALDIFPHTHHFETVLSFQLDNL